MAPSTRNDLRKRFFPVFIRWEVQPDYILQSVSTFSCGKLGRLSVDIFELFRVWVEYFSASSQAVG